MPDKAEPRLCSWCGELVDPDNQHPDYSSNPMHYACGARAALGSVAHIDSHFTWLAGFAADCPMCGAQMPANVRHECYPSPMDAPKFGEERAMPDRVWRVGRKVPLNVYEGDRPVCQCHNEEDAARIVADVEFLAWISQYAPMTMAAWRSVYTGADRLDWAAEFEAEVVAEKARSPQDSIALSDDGLAKASTLNESDEDGAEASSSTEEK